MLTVSWRYVFLLLCFLGVFTSGAILWMLLWMTDRIDQVEYKKTHALIELKLSETGERLRLAVEDHAYWTTAYNMVLAGDNDGVFEDIGSSATDSDLFDQLFIVNAEGDLLHAFDEILGTQARELFDENVASSILAQLRENSAADYVSVTSFSVGNNDFAYIVGALITPDSIAEQPDIPLPALFGVVHLNEDLLAVLSRDTQIMDASVESFSLATIDESRDDHLVIFDHIGMPVATLRWDVDYTGLALRSELLPGVLLMILGIFGICGAAARYFHSQHNSLKRANKVATTDQLTALLNRAGLAEVLRQKNVLQSLEKGHLAAIYLDLNKFKALNDTYGHEAGDLALRVMAQRLQSSVRKLDIVARLGGDEFVCVILDTDPEAAALIAAKRILNLSETPISLDGTEQLVMPSIGIAVATEGTQWETVLSQSDAAMYWAKQEKVDHPVVFFKGIERES
jgi:diguanylate cyclase (GGDEF)-like protein